jgi:hypothetical protein
MVHRFWIKFILQTKSVISGMLIVKTPIMWCRKSLYFPSAACCAVFRQWGNGHLYFCETVNIERYRQLTWQLISLVEVEERDNRFQQDVTTDNTANSM